MNTIIGIFKTYINDNNLDALKEYLLELKETEYEPPIPWDYLFQKVYIHACLKKKRAIVDFLDPRAFETGTLCRFQNASHGLKA